MTSTPTASTHQPNPGRSPTDEIDLGQLVGLLIDRWALIVGATAVFGLGGIFYALASTAIFQADALVQVEEEQDSHAACLRGPRHGRLHHQAEIEIIKSRWSQCP